MLSLKNYFKNLFAFVKENPVQTSIIFVLDALFYLVLFLIPNAAFLWFSKKVNELSFQTLGDQVGNLDGAQGVLFQVLGGLLLSIFLFVLLIILTIVVFKGIIWFLTLKKRIEVKSLLKGIVVVAVIQFIFLIPLIMSASPLAAAAEAGTGYLLPKTAFIPFVIILFLAIYLISLAVYFLVKEGGIWNSLKNAFSKGFKKFFPASIPLLLFCVIMFFLHRTLSTMFINPIFLSVTLIVVASLLSFFGRFFVKEVA